MTGQVNQDGQYRLCKIWTVTRESEMNTRSSGQRSSELINRLQFHSHEGQRQMKAEATERRGQKHSAAMAGCKHTTPKITSRLKCASVRMRSG